MDPIVFLPFLTAALSFVFAAFVADQWRTRRQPYQLVWTVGLLWFGIGALAEFLGGAFGWNEALYRTWYSVGAFGAASYLGLGTIFLLNRTRFGYLVGLAFVLAALFSWLTAARYAREGTPAADPIVAAVVGISVLAAVVVTLTTRLHRPAVAPVAAAFILPGSILAGVLAFTVPIGAPGFAIDAATGAPIGALMPADLRIATPPFNIVGAFALVFGAAFSAFIFMPKVRVMRVTTDAPIVGPLGRGAAVVVNLVASLPATWRALWRGELNSRVPATLLIAIGGFFPSIADGLTRFGVTWALFVGQFIGVLLIFIGFLVSIEVFSDIRLPFTRIVLRRRAERAPG